MEGEGRTSSVRELFRERVRGAAAVCALEGDGERDERRGAARPTVCSDGADGEVKPLRIFPGANCCCGCCGCGREVWLAAPAPALLGPGYCGFLPVRSRKECWAAGGSGALRMLESDDDEMLRAS